MTVYQIMCYVLSYPTGYSVFLVPECRLFSFNEKNDNSTGPLRSKIATADTGYLNDGRAANAAYRHGAVIATKGIRDVLRSKVINYFSFIRASSFIFSPKLKLNLTGFIFREERNIKLILHSQFIFFISFYKMCLMCSYLCLRYETQGPSPS